MAFNPFTYFRKHKKVMFAALTILCMCTFVLCSGITRREYFLDILPQGVAEGKGHRVTTLYGPAVKPLQGERLRQGRQIAARFFLQAFYAGSKKRMADALKKMNMPLQDNPQMDQLRSRQA